MLSRRPDRQPTPVQVDPAELFALDAVICCARLLDAAKEDQSFRAAVALSAVEAAWDVAAPGERRGRRRPESIDELLHLLHEPSERWLPYARRLGSIERQPLALAGRVNPGYARLLAEISGHEFSCRNALSDRGL